MSATFSKCPHKKKPNICAGTPASVFHFLGPGPWTLATRRVSLCSTNGAALLGIKAELGKLRHKGALTAEKFELLKARTKDGAVVA